LVSAEDLLNQLVSTGERVTVCGDGAKVFMKAVGDTPNIFSASFAATDQNALSVAYAGYKAYTQGKAISSDKLQPVYLRASQAEREREEKNK
jgi:tRNA threonylcarbamoyladenosine biosynthesis protein TsaB